MFDLRKLVLWLVVLLVPGGILLLPLLIADMKRGSPQLPAATPSSEGPKTSNSDPPAASGDNLQVPKGDSQTSNDGPKHPPSDGRIPPLAA